MLLHYFVADLVFAAEVIDVGDGFSCSLLAPFPLGHLMSYPFLSVELLNSQVSDRISSLRLATMDRVRLVPPQRTTSFPIIDLNFPFDQ